MLWTYTASPGLNAEMRPSLIGGLGFQRFPERPDRKVTGDVAVRYAGNHTPVMQIYNGAVIAYFMIRKEQIGEIRAPFPVDFICCEILVQLIIEYLMRVSMLISRLLWTDDGTEAKLRVHIFMNGNGLTVRIAFALQIDFHAPIAVDSIVRMIYLLNLCLDFGFPGIIIRLPVFPVVVVCVWADSEPCEAASVMPNSVYDVAR